MLLCLIGCTAVYGSKDRKSWTASIGTDAEYETISAALKAIPIGTAEVTLRFRSTLANAQQDSIISIPELEQLQSVRFEADLSESELDEGRTFRADSVYYVYANGVPLSIGAGIELPNASIFGASSASGKALSSVESTQLSIGGKVANVYGGGYASGGGTAFVSGLASVRIEPAGEVYWKVCGGGLAEGGGSTASVAETNVVIGGKVSYGFGGGAAELGGRNSVTIQSALELSESGKASVALFGGGLASDLNSRYESADTIIRILGEAAWIFGGDYAFAGGSTELFGVATSEIRPDARVSELYAGSFAIDPDSQAVIASAFVTGGEIAAKYTPSSVASKNATVNGPNLIKLHD